MSLRTKLIIGFGLPVALIWALAAWKVCNCPVCVNSTSLMLQAALIATLALAAAGTLIGRSILYPIRKLQSATTGQTNGNLKFSIQARGKDEFATLAAALDAMITRLASERAVQETNTRQRAENHAAALRSINEQTQELEDRRQAMEKIMDNLRLKQAELMEEVNQRKLAEARLKNRVAEVEVLNKGITNLLEDLQDANHLQAQTTASLEAANRELESFSYSVSHDLRAPLRAINGFAEALVEDVGGQISETGRHYLDVITKNAHSMGRLIDDLLAFSRLGRKPMDRTPVDMNMLVKEAIEECRPDPAKRAVEFELEPLPPAQADSALIRQVWVNLISNAVKFTGRKARAKIRIWSFEENGQTVYAIRDNGAGFNMEYADKIFGVFQRLHRPEEFEGTGVGLANVHRILERHGGWIRAEGRENEGAAFFFTIPAA